jgi:regulator of sirC expression with transglutaminase-like and TPR domain
VSFSVSDPLQAFRQAVDGPEGLIDLGRAALTIALDDYPNLDIDAYLGRIDRLAGSVTGRIGAEFSVYRAIAALNTVLFNEQGFRPNRENYFDSKNSFLNEVLDRKTGIPITLSVLYIEVAQRIGLPLLGVGFPGHFLVKYCDANEEIVIDPFDGGEIKSQESLEKLLYEQYRGKLAMQPAFLEATGKKQILRRMLNNLKMIYLRDGAFLKALPVLQRLVILDPAAAEDVRDRGAIYLQLECFQQALGDFERYLQLMPDAADATVVREKIIDLTKQVSQIN